MKVKHKFASAKLDSVDPTLINPSNWNDDHDFSFPVGSLGAGITFSSGTLTLDLAVAEYFVYTLTANVTSIVFSNGPASGFGRSFMILLTQDAATARTVTWPSSFRWDGGAPTVSTTLGAKDLLAGTMLDNTKWDVTLSKARA